MLVKRCQKLDVLNKLTTPVLRTLPGCRNLSMTKRTRSRPSHPSPMGS